METQLTDIGMVQPRQHLDLVQHGLQVSLQRLLLDYLDGNLEVSACFLRVFVVRVAGRRRPGSLFYSARKEGKSEVSVGGECEGGREERQTHSPNAPWPCAHQADGQHDSYTTLAVQSTLQRLERVQHHLQIPATLQPASPLTRTPSNL